MRRLLLLSSLGAAALLVAPIASAQDLQPPPPMQPGIAPPPPMQQPLGQPVPNNEQVQQQETTKKLDEAESSDSGRNFELIYVDGQVGGSYVNMEQFSSTDFALRKSSAGGPAFGLGAGIRLLVFYAGVRLRYNASSLFNLWQMNGELGLKIPISALDFMIGLHGGYSFVGSLGDANRATDTSTPTSNDAVTIRGFNFGLDVALDYYVTSLFSVGVGVIGDALLLNRPAVALPAGLTADQQAAAKNDPLYQKSGTSAGLELGGLLRLGLHFGL